MTLRRQLFLSLTLLFMLMLAASLTVNFYNARRHLQEQMNLHARDTATALAFAIAGATPDSKPQALQHLLDSLFEHGTFSSIVYRDIHGNVLLERVHANENAIAPAWFMRLLPIHAPRATADVMSGWTQLGTVEITTTTTAGYRALWTSFGELLLVLAVASAVVYLLSIAALRLLLRPLQKLEHQAAAICERHFVEQQPLPKTRELRQVVQAMNRMSRKLKTIFHEQLALTESLRAQSHLDPVTGLSNRREFNARLQSVADSESGNGGCLMILQVQDFGRYNLQHGHEAGDECLRVVAAQLQALVAEAPDAIISRRAGADFAVYLPRLERDRARALAAHLVARMASLDLLHGHCIHIGVACCDVLRADHHLLAEADLALRQAQARGHSDWQLFQAGDVEQVAREARQWYTTLTRTLQDRQLTFHYQPVFPVAGNQALLAEIFCRITMQDKLVPAGIFLPMAERFALAEAFDRLIIDEIRQRSERAESQVSRCAAPLCINLSPHSARSPEFLQWFSGYLADYPAFARRLVIETSEYMVRTGAGQIHELCAMLHQRGARLSLDHFGIHSAAFGYLHSLPLDYLKVDRSFIRDIHLNTDNQFYVQSLVQIAHSCDITILAEGVEHQLEWECLQQLGIDGGQGYYLARPDSTLQNQRN
jgi:diguanylate cyclase (GGDEF)-like protein